ncbi:MAG TPA: MucR family transcriptional regulator [Acetobacteraceae bacterium]
MSDSSPRPKFLSLTAQIVAAQVAHNAVPAETLPDLIRSVYATLAQIDTPTAKPERAQPAVPIKRSVFPDYIVCLNDGRKLKTLKRHLMGAFGMTPDQYREHWGLPRDYPMVAPNYAAHRSALAKGIGLGRKRAAPAPEPATPAKPPARRGRKKRTEQAER